MGPTPKTPLPNKLSDLLVLAVLDARKVGKMPGYQLDMCKWHAPAIKAEKTVCFVCMAGAVMACETDVDHATYYSPSFFDNDTRKKLVAIDCMRNGSFDQAFDMLFGMTAYQSEKAIDGMHDARCWLIHSLDRSDTFSVLGRYNWSEYIHAARILKRAGL